ncbi:MAG: radical SAM protein [Christensenellaceae bacterium]|nr:radical SAM protein [Christensenellaceae bacterium]
MLYTFHKSIRRFRCSGIEMIGDSESGIIIGLSDEGVRLVDEILHMKSIDVQSLSPDAQFLLTEMQGASFFDTDNVITSPCNVAYFHVTSKCNLNCVGCYSYEESRNEIVDMPLADVHKVLSNIRNAGVSHLVISGGEPMLRTDICDILIYAKRECRFSKITLISNGIVPKERYERILGLIDEISISIEGYDEISSFIRNGSVQTVLNTVKFLSSVHAPVNMIVTLHKRNLNHVANYIRLSQDLRVPFTFSLLTVPQGSECNGCELDQSDYSLIEAALEKFPLPLSDVPFAGDLGCRVSCGLGKTIISVSSNGKVFPCHMLQDESFCIGNALIEDIKDCVNQHTPWNVEQIIECNDCEVKYLCGGGCYARRIFNSKNINSSHDPCCEMYKSGILATLKRAIQAE